jgi:uncharacterized protein YceK
MKTIIILCCVLMLVGCASVRTDIAKPVLKEEVAWSKMLQDWSIKAYISRDFRAGFLLAATKPYLSQMPVSLNTVIQDIGSAGNKDSEDFKAGAFGGSILAMWGIIGGEGARWLFNQLVSVGALPSGIVGALFGG